MTKIVVAGAGFGGIKVFNHLVSILNNYPELEITLINDVNYFLFTPLLHEVATGSLQPEDITVPLPPMASHPRSRMLTGEVLKIIPSEKKLVTTRGQITYDYLVLGLGSETNFFNTPGAQEFAFSLKDLDDAARIKNRIIKQFEKAQCLKEAEAKRQALTFVVVGGGPTGVELAGELADFCRTTFRKIYGPDLCRVSRIVVVQHDPSILAQFSAGLRGSSLTALGQKRVEVLVNTGVTSVTSTGVTLSTNETLPTETVLWTAGVKPRTLESTDELSQEKGRLKVNSYLQLSGYSNVLVLGDLAYSFDPKTNSPLPMLAQVADRQSKIVAKNILNLINNQPLQVFNYKSQGSIVSLGSWFAVSEVMGFHLAGRVAWILWRGVYWAKMPTISKKLQIALGWLINVFKPRDISLLPFTTHNIH